MKHRMPHPSQPAAPAEGALTQLSHQQDRSVVVAPIVGAVAACRAMQSAHVYEGSAR